MNAALAMIEAAAPKDEIEGALAVQMACTHTAAMAVLARLGDGHGSELRVAALGSADGWGCGWRLGTLLTASAALIVFGWIIQMLIPLPIAIAESASVFCGFSGALAPRCRGPEDVRVVAVVIAPFEFSDIQRQIFPADEAVRLPAPKA